MTERATVGQPLEIDRIERARAERGSVQLRLRGRWLDPAAADEEELLVVQIEGRRHRFPGTREQDVRDGGAASTGASRWAASFTLPDWAEPHHEGQAALWLGSAVVPVPPPGGAAPAPVRPRPAAPPPEPAPGMSAARPSPAEPVAPDLLVGELGGDAGRSGPLADLLLRDTVAALRTELEQRTGEAIRLRSALADAQSELQARIATGAALEAAQEQLRTELGQLRAAVERNRQDGDARAADVERDHAALREQLAEARGLAEQRATEAVHLREELAAAHVARDATASEVAGLRSELDRVGTELAATRERVGAEGGDLGEAERLLADAKALADQLRDRPHAG
jgi:hypothetical protein